MFPFSRIPLAWHNLVHNKVRLLVSLLGIGFAVVLMFVELGFWNALLDAAVRLVRRFNGQLFVVSKVRYTVALAERFPVRRLEQARAVPGVREAFPVYLEIRGALWKDTSRYRPGASGGRNRTAVSHPIRVVAFDPIHDALRIPGVEKQRANLWEPGTVLMDRRSAKDYGPQGIDAERELARHRVRVVGTFDLGNDFTTDGNLVMSDRTFGRLFPRTAHPEETLRLADIGVIQLDADADPGRVREALKQRLSGDVQVLTPDEFIALEQGFWQKATPIGFVFRFGLVMGVIVGLVICFQVLAADVSDRLKQFATLKAIGYRNSYLTRVVLGQALLLSLVAFGPGLAVSWGMYELLGALTGLPLAFTPGGVAAVLLLTVGMCVGAGLLAVRKVQKADPAEVF